MGDGCNECGGLRESLEAIRDDVNEKHRQNRSSIHQIRNDIQRNALELSHLAGKIGPYLDNGQPGVITKMSDKLDRVILELTANRTEKSFLHSFAQHIVGPVVVAVLIALIMHFWK